jgi:hypothetical protein
MYCRVYNWILTAAFALLCSGLSAQELKCRVQVNGQKITEVDPAVITQMERDLNDFMNSKAWTSEVFGPQEKIDCNFFLILSGNPSQDVYTAELTVQSSRPVINSSYNSTLLNYLDKDIRFTYVQNQPILFESNQYISNLSSVLGFYAYLLIGLDYESMGKNGGTKYFEAAERVMQLVPTNNDEAKGWRPFDGVRNRYWFINNLLNSKYEDYRKSIFEYHFTGLDNFYDKPDFARQSVFNALKKLEAIARDNPNNILLVAFMTAKADELIGIFSGASPSEKTQAVNLLKKLDPTNAPKYDKIIKG